MKPRKFIRDHPSITMAIIIGLLVITIYQCFTNFTLRRKLSRYQPETTTIATIKPAGSDKPTEIKVTDTEFSKLDPYKGQQQPATILFWGTDPNSPRDKVRPSISAADSLGLTNWPFTSFPNQNGFGLSPTLGLKQDSLVQLLLDRKTLELSFYDRGISKYYSATYPLDLERYKYNWEPNSGLTYTKNRMFTIGPYVQARYRVFDKVPTVSAGISFKTRKWDYNLGVSLSRDPLLDPKFRPDVEISVTYEFERWLK